MREKLQQLGGFLAGMVIPNIAAIMAWGLITALFIPTGWIPNAEFAKIVGPMITYALPLLMGASMFIQQKMTPVMGDPRQAKMMLFMPVLFTFMFLNLPSGLVLYWTLSNVLQIAQQKYMERTTKQLEKGARVPKKA